MKLQIGRYYKTRDGRKVHLVNTETDGAFAFGEPLGLYCHDGRFGWIEDGRHHCECAGCDLIAPWTEEVGTLEELDVKSGDVVEMVSENSHAGERYTIQEDGKVLSNRNAPQYYGHAWGKFGSNRDTTWRIITRAQPEPTGPVRTVTTTRQEIVPGRYGCVDVTRVGSEVGIYMTGMITRDELTDAIATLTAIRDAM